MGELFTLSIETSDERGGVALLEGHRVAAERMLTKGLRHDRELLPAVEALLAAAGIAPEHVALVAVGTGPGSFTGLRVGIAAAKAFAWAVGAQVLGVSSLDALASDLDDATRSPYREVVGVVDARRGAVYVARYGARDLAPRAPLAIAPPGAALAAVERPALLFGPGLRVEALRAPLAAEGGVALAPEAAWEPRPGPLGRLARRRHDAGARMAPREVEPLYLRLAAAEEKLEGRP